MKKIERYKKVMAMSAAALGLLAALTVESTMAYFTTYVSAGGSQVVNLEASTQIREEVKDMTKHITLKNISTKGDCFVRVKVFHGQGVSVTYPNDEENNWYMGDDGYMYYKPILPVGEVTAMLDVKIDTTGLQMPGLDPNDPDAEVKYIKEKFNVVVIQECTPVLYDENGVAYADWNTKYTDFTEMDDTQGEEAGN